VSLLFQEGQKTNACSLALALSLSLSLSLLSFPPSLPPTWPFSPSYSDSPAIPTLAQPSLARTRAHSAISWLTCPLIRPVAACRSLLTSCPYRQSARERERGRGREREKLCIGIQLANYFLLEFNLPIISHQSNHVSLNDSASH
jgi:hypothetical protein